MSSSCEGNEGGKAAEGAMVKEERRISDHQWWLQEDSFDQLLSK